MKKLIFSLLIFLSYSSFACSLWSVTGSQTMYLAKNRDWAPDHEQKLEWAQPAKGYKYFGLVAQGNEAPGFKMGINEKGLSIISASLSSIPRKERLVKNKHGLIVEILGNYGSVDEVLSHREIFKKARPMNYIIADGKKMSSIEVGLNEKISIVTKEKGQLLHTNHILSPELNFQNKKIATGSITRLKRLEELLSALASPQLDDMKRISRDQNAGADASLWRTGSTPKKTRTLSTWIVEYPLSASPTLYLRVANPKMPEQEKTLSIDSEFWDKKPAL